MNTAEHLTALDREGRLLAAAADGTDLGTSLAACPDWTLRDLLGHLGGVHRWATAIVADRRDTPPRGLQEVVGVWPEDRYLVRWFSEGHAALVQALQAAGPDLKCWTFVPVATPLAFWARRQAHETAIHRADAEAAIGKTSTYDPAFAADGIDEIVLVMASRPGTRLRSDPERSIRFRATDTGTDWIARVQPDGTTIERGPGPADCTLQGRASDLYLWCWNRDPAVAPKVSGDAALQGLWRSTVRIRWSE